MNVLGGIFVVGLVMFRLFIHLQYTQFSCCRFLFSEWEYMYRAIILPKQNKTKTKIRKRACLNIFFFVRWSMLVQRGLTTEKKRIEYNKATERKREMLTK